MTIDSRKIAVVVLAAGNSSRMREPKQLLPLGGSTLVERTVDAVLETDGWPVIVVLGAYSEKIRPRLLRRPVIVAENPAWAEGMASSLRTGLSTVAAFSSRIESVLVCLSDQPAFDADIARRLMAVHREASRRITAARYGGRLGAPAIFDRSLFPALGGLVGDEGARKILQGADSADTNAVELPALEQDIDTAADYAALLRRTDTE